jgi:hypothetical protein
MSDYVHKKVVRLPFPKEILDKCNTDDVDDCYSYLSELLGDLWNNQKRNGFDYGITHKGTYIDWVYYYTYGEKSGDFGFVRLLTQKELDTIKPYFDKLEINYKDEDLRIVDYCYYNCCEPTDYYDIKQGDDSELFINDK